MSVDRVSPDEYARLARSGYAGPKETLLPQTREQWAGREPYSHWVMRPGRRGPELAPVLIDGEKG